MIIFCYGCVSKAGVIQLLPARFPPLSGYVIAKGFKPYNKGLDD